MHQIPKNESILVHINHDKQLDDPMIDDVYILEDK